MNEESEPDKMSGSIHEMTDEALVARVKTGFQKIRQEIPYILELRKRFAALPRGKANIAGCKSWTEFCGKVLHRSDRQIRRAISPDRHIGQHVRAVPIPAGTFRIVYADPPWDYGTGCFPAEQFASGARGHYPTMTLEDICTIKLPVIAEDSVVFMWATVPMIENALKVIAAWGFQYKSQFVWDKVRHNRGHYNSVRHELLLIATRGSCTPDNPELLDSVVTIEKSSIHSRKPDYFRELIDRLYPFGRRVELFARGTLPKKWAGYGDEFDCRRALTIKPPHRKIS